MDCLITSGFNFEGHRISNYLAPVASKRSFTGITFVKNEDAPQQWEAAIDDAILALKSKALAMGANAIIGFHIEHFERSPLIVVILSGTAVTIEPA